jgi:hypothetical protein
MKPINTINGNIPQGWEIICDRVQHPTNGEKWLTLMRNTATRKYALLDGGSIMSCPQDWSPAELTMEVEEYKIKRGRK